jgi:hypothetical protein
MKSDSRLENDPSASEFPSIEENSVQEERLSPTKSRLIYHCNGEYIDLTGNYIGEGLLQAGHANTTGKMFGMAVYRTN